MTTDSWHWSCEYRNKKQITALHSATVGNLQKSDQPLSTAPLKAKLDAPGNVVIIYRRDSLINRVVGGLKYIYS